MIVLFPQVVSGGEASLNPEGCWDIYGYTGDAWMTKDSMHGKIFMTMIDELALVKSGARSLSTLFAAAVLINSSYLF